MFVLSMASSSSGNDINKVSKELGWKLEKRIKLLDTYVDKVVQTPVGEWPDIGRVPEDMVIYRYVNDSLQSWSNQFSVINDDIASRLVFQRMTSLRNRITSPLSEITEELSYINIGPKWYVAKAVIGHQNDKILAGLEVKNTLIDDIRRNDNGVNKELELPARYLVFPLNNDGGADVRVGDTPLFKVLADTNTSATFFDNSILKWLALLLFAIATMLLLASHRTLRVYAAVTFTLTILMAMAYIWAQRMSYSMDFFSPTIYADGPYMNSLGILMMTNGFIIMFALCSYMVRYRLIAIIRASRKHVKTKLAIFCFFVIAAALGLFTYTHITLKSLILNSNITLELYRWNDHVPYTITVYMSYTGLLFCILLMLQCIKPVARRYLGFRYNLLNWKGIILFSLLCAIYFTFTSGTLGFRKEKDRTVVWANRLAVDRNLSLEIQLRSVEESIANDQLISALSMLENTGGMLQNRVSEYYLSRVRQDNFIEVLLFNEEDQKGIEYFNEIARNGTPISEGSRFLFLSDGNGRSSYAGTFYYWSKDHGLSRMLLIIEPNSNREDRGYYSILGRFSKPGEINIPSFYSYAKYIDNRLVLYKGNYPYPTVSHQLAKEGLEVYDNKAVRLNGYVHFMSMVSEDELIMISRKQRNPMAYFTSLSYLFLIICALTMAFARSDEREKVFKSNYFRTKINSILFISSFLILLSMTVISILFVYKRNEANMHDLMSTKINTIQALTETRVRQAQNWQNLITPEITASLENIGNTTKSDITLYTPEGKVFHSTTPEVFEKQILGSRINEEAFHNIKYMNQRFYIHRERIADFSYWMLYAPIFNDNREILAIISTPYTDRNYDFRREAFSHAAIIVNLFLLLLIGSLLFSTRAVNQMFTPLVEMGRKMNKADINNPEFIIYKREDEISSLVDAYNRMLQDLSDSTKKLAAAERDKAWSEMARQVAHEIKNPLTPIKLEIQRLIRLKEKNNPAWEEKFDKVSSVVLEHIDILTDTANEFSTFAKLYSEEHVLLDLNRTLKDQLLIFDNKENIQIQYIGMDEAYVMAPKPQLIRVFVNLITNAIQAVEIMQKEAMENDGERIRGTILICLRNSTKEGYYDIVFDDNGPGVNEENQSKLFTPNFTTKSAGTGLGLAICRNIITKCDGEIRYQKSFALGGASFTVTLPRHLPEQSV